MVQTEEFPSMGISQPSGQSREQLHEDEMHRALKAQIKISRIEMELAQARDKIDDLEAASELKDRQLRAALKLGDRPSAAVQQIAWLRADLAQAQEENKNLKAIFELQPQEKDEIIKDKRNRIKDLLQAREEPGFGATVSSGHGTGLRDFTNALLKDFHTAIALAENHTRIQDLKLKSLVSAADQLNTAVEQANDRTETIVTDARKAYDRGIISRELFIETEEQYHSEAELLVSVRDAVANQVVEDYSSLEKLRKFNVAARRKYGRYLGGGISSAYPKPSSGPERSDEQQDNAIAEQGDTTGGNTPTEGSEAGSMFRGGATAEEDAIAKGVPPRFVPAGYVLTDEMSRRATTVAGVNIEKALAGKALAAGAPTVGAAGGVVLIAEAPVGVIPQVGTTSGGSAQAAPARGGAQAARRRDMQWEKAKAANPRELARRRIGTPPTPKPEKPSKPPAELEILRLTNRQTLHCLNP